MEHLETKQAFLSLYDQQVDAVYRFCSYKTSDTAVAEDLTQETFMRFWQSVRAGMWPGNPRAYLFTLARNLVIDWYRKKKHYSLERLQSMSGFDVATDEHVATLLASEAREAQEAIAKLDAPSRHVLEKRFFEGWSPKEIAAETGETANAISVRINRALKQVRLILQTGSP